MSEVDIDYLLGQHSLLDVFTLLVRFPRHLPLFFFDQKLCIMQPVFSKRFRLIYADNVCILQRNIFNLYFFYLKMPNVVHNTGGFLYRCFKRMRFKI